MMEKSNLHTINGLKNNMSNIDDFIKQVKKDIDFTGTIDILDDIKKLNVIPFGIPSLDSITGLGGVARGRVSEISGRESSGKTSLCLKLVTEAQKLGIKTCYIDVELAMDKSLATMMGVDTKKLIVARPATGEEAFELIESMSESGCGLIIVDSVSAMVPGVELEDDYDQNTMALQARMMSKGLRKVIGTILKQDTALVFVNQLRGTIAKMPGQPTTTTSGGFALKFYANLRISTVRTAWIGTKENAEGMTIKIMVDKNKSDRPQLTTEVDFIYGEGFNITGDLLKVKVDNGEIERVGNTFFIKGEKIGDKKAILEYLEGVNLSTV